MKLRYMIEYVLRDQIRNPRYEPIGVWVQGPEPSLRWVRNAALGYGRGARIRSCT